MSRVQVERAAAAAARNVNAYGQKEEGPSRWQERKEAKRQMYLMSTEKAVKVGVRKDQKQINGQCQKCFQPGHWTYECKNERIYMTRPSRSQQLRNPKLQPKPLDPSEVRQFLDEGELKKLKKEEDEKKRSRKKDRKKRKGKSRGRRSVSSSDDSESDSSSSSESDSSSTSASSSGSESESESEVSSDSQERKKRSKKRRRYSPSSSSDSESSEDEDDDLKKKMKNGKR